MNAEGLACLQDIPLENQPDIPPENQPDIPPSRSLTSTLGPPGSLPENTPSLTEASYFSGLLAATRTSHSIGSLDYLPPPQETESSAFEQESQVLQSSDVQEFSGLPDSTDHSSGFSFAGDFPAQHLHTTGQQQMAGQPESTNQLEANGWQQWTDGVQLNAHQQAIGWPISQLPANTDQLPPQAPVAKYQSMLPHLCGLCSDRLFNLAGLRGHWASKHVG